jgi:ABC-type tungstate transport system permease subunit
MAMIIDGTNGVTFPNSTVQASAGQILQVVNAGYATEVTNSTTTPTDTGLTATITPKFSTSKILVIASQTGCAKYSANIANSFQLMGLQ